LAEFPSKTLLIEWAGALYILLNHDLHRRRRFSQACISSIPAAGIKQAFTFRH